MAEDATLSSRGSWSPAARHRHSCVYDQYSFWCRFPDGSIYEHEIIKGPETAGRASKVADGLRSTIYDSTQAQKRLREGKISPRRDIRYTSVYADMIVPEHLVRTREHSVNFREHSVNFREHSVNFRQDIAAQRHPLHQRVRRHDRAGALGAHYSPCHVLETKIKYWTLLCIFGPGGGSQFEG
jgi:hypothetical protein